MNVSGLERLMPGASDAERNAVAERLVRRAASSGDVVVRAKDNSSTLMLVEAGRLDVTLEREGQTVVLPPVEASDWIGEVDLLHAAPSATTLTATTDTVLLTIDAAGLDALLEDNPVAASALLTGLTERLASRLRTATLPSLTLDEGGALHAEELTKDSPAPGWVARLIGSLFGGTST